MVSKGFDVTIVEKHHQAGGRLNLIEKDGFKFDLGPTFFSMSYEFDELIKSTGIDYPFEFIELEPLFTVNIDGIAKTFTIYKDLDKLAAQFEGVEPRFREKMEAHLKKTEILYHDTVYRIVHRNFISLPDYLFQMSKVPLKHTPLIFKTMWSELCDSFESKEARMIFSLVGFFLGATPFDTPAIFSLLNYIEMKHDGYHNVKGGMYHIIESMVKVLEDKGVKIHYNTEIVGAEQKNGTLLALTDGSGKRWTADQFIINADAASFRGKVFHHKKWNATTITVLVVIFMVSIGVEIIGIATGKIFGVYEYGRGLGIKIADVPVIIGLNWVFLVYASNGITSKYTSNPILIIAGAALLMYYTIWFLKKQLP